ALPGHRDQPRAVPDTTAEAIDEALEVVGAAAGRAGVVAGVGAGGPHAVGAEARTAAGREIVTVIFDADGSRLGEQVKTQIDPSEERWYVAGSGRRTFTAAGLTFGVAICHEAYRYPEITRALALGDAQVVFVPHYVVTDDGSLPTVWCDARNPYNEKSLLVRALENTIYVAAANNAGPTQGSATGITGPDESLVASLPYGEVGVAAAEIDLDAAD